MKYNSKELFLKQFQKTILIVSVLKWNVLYLHQTMNRFLLILRQVFETRTEKAQSLWIFPAPN